MRTPEAEAALAEHVALTREANGLPPVPEPGELKQCPRHGVTLRYAADQGGVLEFWFTHLECSDPSCDYETWS